MKTLLHIITLITLGIFASPSAMAAASSSAAQIEEVERLAKRDDGLGVRVLVRRMAKARPDAKSWTAVREILHETPRFGDDILELWERVRPNDAESSVLASDVDRLVNAAETAMSERRFDAAFTQFQNAARLIKADANKGNKQNRELYYSVLHLMGSSLYGAGRFTDALDVLNWLPPVYSGYKQVLFEKVWSAFRAGKVSEANGAVASLHSSYFGGFLEPEAYLIQIYLYRKMCRDADLSLVMRDVRDFKKRLDGGTWRLENWLHADPRLKPYYTIIRQKRQPSSDLVTANDRNAERKRLRGSLKKQFTADRARLKREIDRVLAFADMAFSTTSKDLPKVAKLPSQEELFKSGLEMWPVDDGEDWLDEIGSHVFIGESQCTAIPPGK